jgi:predicted glycoside hydrolase/deacetylase ChbG (UPF0249 family)
VGFPANIMKPIILSADDFAQSSSIDDAIIMLIQQGRLSATSCMTLSSLWPQAAKLLNADIKAKADLGLHLDFTQYRSPARLNLGMLIMRALTRTLSAAKIRQTIITQLDAFESALGHAPDYIDGHQHVHQLPQIRTILVEVLLARYKNNLPWIRIANTPVRDGLKGLIISWLGAKALKRLAHKHGFRYSAQLLGVYDFTGTEAEYLRRISEWFHYAKTSPYIPALMCHPAIDNGTTPDSHDVIHAARLREYQIFSGNAFGNLLKQNKLKPAKGRQVL